METVDILALAAHSDDVELTCGGTLLKMVDQGYSVGILDLTEGEMGTRGTPEIRAAEAEAARKVLGAQFRTRLDLGDSQLTNSIENRMVVAQQIRDRRPRTVILPYWTAVIPITTRRRSWDMKPATQLVSKKRTSKENPTVPTRSCIRRSTGTSIHLLPSTSVSISKERSSRSTVLPLNSMVI